MEEKVISNNELKLEKSENNTKNEAAKKNITENELNINSSSTLMPSTSSIKSTNLKRSRDESESSDNPESKEASTSEENFMQYAKKTRKDNLMIKKEKSWTEFLLQLDDYTPI
eukprot:jgi/Orpsp1_1/1192152/evm.model.d7180000090964.1